MSEWWRDPRCHFGGREISDPTLTDRSDLSGAIQFILKQLDLEDGARVLDLCCGPGRYVLGLAESGLNVVGIDLIEDCVVLARQMAKREGVAAEIVVGDMREISYVNHFDAVINVGTSFGFFEAPAEDQAVVEQVSAALKPGGRFLLEMGNRDYLLKNFEAASAIDNPDGSITEVERTFDYVRSRINTTFRRSLNGELVESWFHSWRAYTLAEVTRILSHAKLELVSTFGGWNSEAYGVDAHRMLVISEKRAT